MIDNSGKVIEDPSARRQSTLQGAQAFAGPDQIRHAAEQHAGV